MKKVISILLSFVMLTSITAGLNLTVFATETISTATVRITKPAPGAKISRAYTADKKGWSVWKTEGNELNWYDTTNGTPYTLMTDDSKFVEGHTYMARLIASADTGYQFAEDGVKVDFQNVPSYGNSYKGYYKTAVQSFECSFKCAYNMITSVTLSAEALAKGDVLSNTHFIATSGAVQQTACSFTRNGETVSAGTKVTYGTYGASIIIAPKDGCKFADNVSVKMGSVNFTVVNKIGMGIIVKNDNIWTINCTHPSTTQKYDATTHWDECADCGEKTNIETHTFSESTVDGGTKYTCTKCGFTKTSKNKENGFLYAAVNGGVEVVAYDGSDTNVVVPATLGGQKVVGLGNYAFAKYANKTTFKSITLPASITNIGNGAFNGCSALTSVNIPANVKRIEAETFLGCSALGSVTIPYGVEFIGESAFQGSGISSVLIPCSVKTIKGSAFRSCENLGSVVIPDSVTELGNAFLSCTGLKSVEIGKGITTIAQATFDGCKAINTLTLSATLTKINKYNFDQGSVTKVNYRGTEQQFNAMDKTTNTDLTSATKTYNYDVKTDIGQHKYSVFQTVAPTCVADGYTLVMCEGCGDSFKTDITPLTGVHKYNSGAVTTEPTCAAEGVKTYLCNECGAAKYEVVPPTGAHDYNRIVTKKATLSANGELQYECKTCGEQRTVSIAKIQSVSLSATKYTYNGKVKTPSVTVKDAKGKTVSKDYYTVTYAKGRKNIGKYAVKVTFKGDYSGTKTVFFNINPKGTSLKKVTKGRKAFTATWAKQTTQTTGYQIQYSTDKNFKKGNKTVTIKKNKTVKTTVKKLKAKKTYYVRIRTYKTVNKTKYYSSWSKSKSVKTK